MKLFKYIAFLALFTSLTLNANTLRIEVDELLNNFDTYKVLDTRQKSDYLNGHIKTALNFPISATYEHKKINGKLADPAGMQKIIRELGLTTKDTLVIYDDGTFFDAARLFWALEVYGFKDVKLLNGGIKQWKAKNLETTKEVPTVEKSEYIVTVNHDRLATKLTTQIATKNPKQIILDARGIKAYKGEVSASKRYGHIPKAIHFPASHNIDYEEKISTLKTPEKLKELYSKININQKVVVYCAIGKIAATNYFALRELGYNVANYDASWKEWGNDFNLPIINKSGK